MRRRDLETLEATTYDVLVIGGGIHGLTVAYEASRGLRTAVIDASDIGSAASFSHQKTVHGGL
jgi:glycerol-3-phosphate dehydrogenase